ncbi:MAG: hypothetical protein ABW063_13995 [Caulobacter sp.]
MGPSAVGLDTPPESVEAYIEEMLGELSVMAARRGHRHLASLLQMAALEAARMASDVEDAAALQAADKAPSGNLSPTGED